MIEHVISYIGVGAITSLAASIEILSRYRDFPAVVLRDWSGWAYIATNVVVGLLAYLLADIMNWDIGKQIAENASDKVQNIVEVIAIGLGSMIFLRVSLIHIQRDDREISIGPSYLLNVLLEFTSNRMSRRRAVYIDETVREMMATVDWEKAKMQLPSYCFSLMNTSAEQQKSFSQELTSLDVKSMDENTKNLHWESCYWSYLVRMFLRVP